MTHSEAVREAARLLRAAGIQSPIRDSEDMLRHLTGMARHELVLAANMPVPGETLERFRALAARRASREPLQHVTGEAWFMGRRFLCSPAALVPRPETELVFERFLGALPRAPDLLLDLGTGSGVMGVCLALQFPQATIVGSDVSKEALHLAASNSALHGTGNLFLVRCDLMSAFSCLFDGIVANLPYIPGVAMDDLQPEVRFDPAVALDGGAGGMEVIERFVSSAHERVRPGGVLALEASGRQICRIVRLLEGSNEWDRIAHGRDLAGRARWVTAVRKPA
ncbi:peptide chain release factor N(5)-glutamine methyltransferase [Candidatus Fermentibacteria bacterium]|nr:peptide chain release factor N(5)-glutamine methyltransferase [Candidatus Fermentibacteria bacterium]